MNFGMTILNQNIETKENYAIWILTALFIHIFTEDFFEDITNDIERWFDTSNYDKNEKRPLPIGTNKKVIGLFKDKLGGKIMKEFCVLRVKTYSYLMDNDSGKKKLKE